MKRLLLLAAMFALAATPSYAKAKSCKPVLATTLLALQADLQRAGWWQVVPVGQNPNDASYLTFLQDALAILGSYGLNGSQVEILIDQAEGDGC